MSIYVHMQAPTYVINTNQGKYNYFLSRQDLKPEKGQESGKIAEDFWRPAIKAICDSKFVDTLIAFDMNQVPVRTLRLLEEKIFQHEEADVAKIKNYSTAAEGKNACASFSARLCGSIFCKLIWP